MSSERHLPLQRARASFVSEGIVRARIHVQKRGDQRSSVERFELEDRSCFRGLRSSAILRTILVAVAALSRRLDIRAYTSVNSIIALC